MLFQKTLTQSQFIGHVFAMDYDEANVLCHDKTIRNVGGVPQLSFLIATSKDGGDICLLRVTGTCPLPTDMDLMRTKIQSGQQKVELDPISLSHLQYGGLKCRTIGSIFENQGTIFLGSDIESFLFSSQYSVYKPTPEDLGFIVNFVNPDVIASAVEDAKRKGFASLPQPIEIGSIRYTSANRMQRNAPNTPVTIYPSDFLGRRTGILGMTRTGKSNTTKTIVAAVHDCAEQSQAMVGQIIFDINGEYANPNVQDDDNSIWNVFQDTCVRYRSLDTPGFEDLRINFFLDVREALMLISWLSRNDKYRDQTDLNHFLESSLERPDRDDFSAINRWRLRKAVFQCILYVSGYEVENEFMVDFSLSQGLVTEAVNKAQIDGNLIKKNGKTSYQMPIGAAMNFFLALRELYYENQTASMFKSKGSGESIIEPTLRSYLNVLSRKNDKGTDIRGWRAIQEYTGYHSSKRTEEVTKEIYDHLKKGRIVILDLSVGPYEIRTILAKRIAKYIFQNSLKTFVSGGMPTNIVIYVEEAHNIIGKKDELYDVWPRIAKEGGKANLAFVYGTQEPSSVHPNILSNTENLIVTYLNNDDETRVISKYYDFKDFQNSIRRAHDVGFARIKTKSSMFVVPVQINKFDPKKIMAKKGIIEKNLKSISSSSLLDIF